MAFVLLIGSGLLTFSFATLLNMKPEFQAENILSVRVSLPNSRYKDDNSANNFFAGLRERLQTIPGVRTLGLTSLLPFSGEGNASLVTLVGRALGPGQKPPVPATNACDSGYLSAMKIPILRGRGISGF